MDPPRGLKIGLIVDQGRVPRFAAEAIGAIEGAQAVSVFSCTNTGTKRRLAKHGAYYALNLLAVRNAWTRSLPVEAAGKQIAEWTEFDSGYDGAWQTLPDSLVDALAGGGFDLILKFGMGLLRVPPPERLAVPILSYHHGDPDRFRGRPAGFWEMVAGEPVMGQIVQVISDRLDAGRIVAFGETRVLPWSYRATLIEAFRQSPLLINRAIRNTLNGVSLPKPCTGRNYRLPSNLAVLRLAGKMAFRKAYRLAYGALAEKRWKVSLAPEPAEGVHAVLAGRSFPAPADWRTLVPAAGYVFYADPFFNGAGEGVLVEALRSTTGRGEIVLVKDGDHLRVSGDGGHMSYPASVGAGGAQYVLPETVGWSPPRLYRLTCDGLSDAGLLQIDGDPRITDPTLIENGGRFFLFGNARSAGSNVLHLWVSEAVHGPYRLHPESPVRISPAGSRMGGSILRAGGRLFRIGQDFRYGYGDGLVTFEIETLSEREYAERQLAEIRFRDRKGPHTLNARDGELLFDWYRNKLSPLAGYRRLVSRMRLPSPWR